MRSLTLLFITLSNEIREYPNREGRARRDSALDDRKKRKNL